MSLTYTWSVTGIKKKNVVNSEGATLADAVIQTYWKVIGTDENGHEGSFSGATPLSADNVSEANFIPLASLTEEQVIGWIQDIVVGGYWDHVQERIQKQIDEQEVTEANLPWAPEPDESTPSV